MNISHTSKKTLLFLLLSLFTFLSATEIPEEKKLIVTSKKKFSANEPLKFSINTGSRNGFVYLVYIDKKGGTSLLYPNNKTIDKKKGGQLQFPKDFGGKNIKTTKDCKGCKEEKTTIFVLLSDDPIENIQSMDEKDLKSIQTQKKSKSRGLFKEENNVLINNIDFIVE